jgi:glutamate-1-semialdehyde aminotransferase
MVTVEDIHAGLPYSEPHNIFFTWAKGSKLYDVEGKMYTAFLLGYSPLILGHCHQSARHAAMR